MGNKRLKHNSVWVIRDTGGDIDIAFIDLEDGTYNSMLSRECVDLGDIDELIREIYVPEVAAEEEHEDPIQCLILWLEDNIGLESELHFDNEGRVKSQDVLDALIKREEERGRMIQATEKIVSHFDGETECTEILDMVDEDLRKALDPTKHEETTP
jgi:hypothetical protein